VLQRVAVCCGVLQCVAVYIHISSALQCVAVRCSVLQRVSACCGVLQSTSTYHLRCSVLQYIAECRSLYPYFVCVAVCCSVSQRATVWCSVLQRVVVCHHTCDFMSSSLHPKKKGHNKKKRIIFSFWRSKYRDFISFYLYKKRGRKQEKGQVFCLLKGFEGMGSLRLAGSIKLQVAFAEYSLFHRALLQKSPMILRSLLIVAIPYLQIPAKRNTLQHTPTQIHSNTLHFFFLKVFEGIWRAQCAVHSNTLQHTSFSTHTNTLLFEQHTPTHFFFNTLTHSKTICFQHSNTHQHTSVWAL